MTLVKHSAWVLIALVACGPEKSGGASAGTIDTASSDVTTVDINHVPSCLESIDVTSGGPSETCPAHLATDACCCFAIRGDSWTTESICGIHDLCPTIELHCQEPYLDCDPELLTVVEETAIDCALAVLAGDVAGRVSWKITGGQGFAVTDVRLDLVGDGTVFRQSFEYEDYAAEVADVSRHVLPPSTYFADCIKSPSWLSRFLCVQNATACGVLATCLEGFRCSLGIDCPNSPSK